MQATLLQSSRTWLPGHSARSGAAASPSLPTPGSRPSTGPTYSRGTGGPRSSNSRSPLPASGDGPGPTRPDKASRRVVGEVIGYFKAQSLNLQRLDLGL